MSVPPPSLLVNAGLFSTFVLMEISPHQLQDLVVRLGPSLPDVVEAARLDATQWAVAFESGANVLLDWANDPPRILLSSLLGRPHPDRCLHVYQTLLAFNSLWVESNGTWLALNGTEGEVTLMYELPPIELTLDALQDAVVGMAALAGAWCEFVMADPESTVLPPMVFGMAA